MDEVNRRLQSIVDANSDARLQLENIHQLLKELTDARNVEGLKALVDRMLCDESSSLSLFSRPVLRDFVERIGSLPQVDVKLLALFCFERLKNRAVCFDEEDKILRDHMASCLEAEGDFRGAAQYLAGASLDARSWISPNDKVEKYIRIAELFLLAKDFTNAEAFCNRAGMCIHEIPNDSQLVTRHKLLHCRILDIKLRFIDAAVRFYELSQLTPVKDQDKDVQLEMLSNAVTCAILSPAGPKRAKLLMTLIKDDRIASARNYESLLKVFMQRLIKPHEVEAFADTLKPHQKAPVGNGQTVVSQAIMQHNVLAASRKCRTMQISALSRMLQLDETATEQLLVQMLQAGALNGVIDQTKGIVRFNTSHALHIENWDRRIFACLDHLNKAVERISNKHSAEELLGQASVN